MTTRDLIADITSGWRNPPLIEVVPSARALPVAAPDDALGMYLRGQVWLVEQPHSHPLQVLAHEAIGHHGVRTLLGADWRMTMRDLLQGIKGGGDRALTRASWRVRDAYVDDAGEFMLTGIAEADEVLARLAEAWADPRTAAVAHPSRAARARAYWADFRRRWMYQDIAGTAEQARVLLADASELILRGYPAWHPLAWWYSAHMAHPTKPMGPKNPARSLRESEQLLAAARQSEGSWAMWQFIASVLGFLVAAGFLLYCAWDLLVAPFFR